MASRKKPQVRRSEAGKFVKGTSGNPGGEPQWVDAIKEALHESAKEGAKLCLSIIKGKPAKVVIEGEEREVFPTFDNRLRALELALKHTVPVPKAQVEVTGPGGAPVGGVLASLTAEDLVRLARGDRSDD